MDRHEVAIKAARERWNPSIPQATHSGKLKIGNLELECDVLPDGTRLIRAKNILKILGRGKIGGEDRKRAEEANLPVFLIASNLRPYCEPEYGVRAKTIFYRSKDGNRCIGYEATILPEACKIFDRAFIDGVLKGNQIKVAENCKNLIYALAKTGITALIDECTGYQYVRERTALQELMQKWIVPEGREWVKRFPDEFFEQCYRLHGWEYPKVDRKNHPSYLGKFINKYVYEKLEAPVLNELQRINPIKENGARRHKHHQFLTEDVGHDQLRKQLNITTAFMKVARDVEDFKKLMEKL